MARKRPRRWWAISVRAMLLLVLAVGVPMGWWARQAHLQRATVARIEAAGGAVVYDFELRDAARASSELGAQRLLRMSLTSGDESKEFALQDIFHADLMSHASRPAPTKPQAEPWKDRARRILGVDIVDSVTHAHVIHSDSLRDDDLASLVNFPRLESLDLTLSRIRDSGMVHIGKLRGLKNLRLDMSRLTDASLTHLEALDQLEGLCLSGTGSMITDASLARLKGMTKLRHLSIAGPKITDAGLKPLMHLNLRLLFLDAPNVTEEGLAQFHTAMPRTEIHATMTDRSGHSRQVYTRPD